MDQSKHLPVLLEEAISSLKLNNGQTVVDATLGFGGHALAIAKVIGNEGTLVGFDLNPVALTAAQQKISDQNLTHFIAIPQNYRFMAEALKSHNITAIDAALFDLGVNSDQLDDPSWGFSFKNDGPLLMRLDGKSDIDDLTAEEVVNTWAETSIADILYGFADERYSRSIAKAIVEARKTKPIKTTQQLVTIIESAVPSAYRRGKIHCATRTFMAIRMAVNDELGAIKEGLTSAYSLLKPGGRLAVISFHSVEATLVKDLFKQFTQMGGELVTKKVIKASRSEQIINRRARSAQLRVIEKHATNF